jgi:hypothetical protein
MAVGSRWIISRMQFRNFCFGESVVMKSTAKGRERCREAYLLRRVALEDTWSP